MKKQSLLLFPSMLVLSGCITTGMEFPELKFPKLWSAQNNSDVKIVEKEALKAWWSNFNDPALDALIEKTLEDSPDRKIAEARITEARGLLRTARSFYFPRLGFTGNGNRQDFGFAGPGNFYDVGFDLTYELDVFGRVRNSKNAQERRLNALEAQYHDITLTLISDVARSYINFRAAQKQSAIAQKNLDIQKETLELIKQQHDIGEAPQLDVERAENIVNTTRASIPEFRRLADNYRLQLSVLTGALPEDIFPLIEESADIPGISLEPVLMAPADILSLRPDIRAASANLEANTSLSKAAVADLFPTFNLEGFFGYSEGPFAPTELVWRVLAGTAVALVDFGRIEGAIDAARAREVESFELMRKTVLYAVTEVETAFSDASYINEQRGALQKAYKNAERSFGFSEDLYKEGEISFLDVLDAQRVVNEAESALITAQAAQAESYIRLYKSFGIY